MSRHLSRDEILDAAEGTAGASAHLAGCESCRAEVETLARALAEARSNTIPEPSPLFWDHFARRVSDAVRREATPAASSDARRSRFGWRARWRVVATAGVAACALALVVAVVGRQPASAPRPQPIAAVASVHPLASAPSPGAEDDESWQVLTELVEPEVEAGGDAVALVDGPGGAEAAAQQLSEEERGELLRLLRSATEAKRSRVQG